MFTYITNNIYTHTHGHVYIRHSCTYIIDMCICIPCVCWNTHDMCVCIIHTYTHTYSTQLGLGLGALYRGHSQARPCSKPSWAPCPAPLLPPLKAIRGELYRCSRGFMNWERDLGEGQRSLQGSLIIKGITSPHHWPQPSTHAPWWSYPNHVHTFSGMGTMRRIRHILGGLWWVFRRYGSLNKLRNMLEAC